MASSPIASTSTAEPAWDVARLFPFQGRWSEHDYFDLTELTNQLVEFTAGRVEVLEMPTTSHQDILLFLLEALKRFVLAGNLGKVSIAPLKVRVDDEVYREPDLVFMLQANAARVGERFWLGADLVMEIVSGSEESRRRDYETKRSDYAKAGIAEYWIVDPFTEQITVLTLDGSSYRLHGEFGAGESANSILLSGFAVDVADVMAAAKA